MIKSTSKPPQQSIITQGFSPIDYCDSYSVVKKTDQTVDEITAILFTGPKWMDVLFKPWYKLLKLLGMTTMKKEPAGENPYYPVGSKAVMFTVTERNDHEIVMGEQENILNFRTSVLKEELGDKTLVHLTTLVKYNNFWGKLYFFPVKPFHRMISKNILKKFRG